MQTSDVLTTARSLSDRLDEASLCVIDCRFDLADPDAGRRAYETGHIPGAAYADLDTDLAAPVTASSGRHPLPAADAAQATFRRLGVNQASEVVVYDDAGGAYAARAWWMLRWLGHERVRLLDGGISAWQRAGLPLENGDTQPEPGDFIARPREGMIVTTDELLRTDFEQTVLCDARDEARFEGRQEPIDRVAGHIPGARNTPFRAGLNDEGLFLAPEALAAAWTQTLGDKAQRDWIGMCGSGVTACHLAVQAAIAGVREPKIYIGSWSEWIRDPGRPVASV